MVKPRVYVTRQLFDEAIRILEDAAKVGVYEGVDDVIPRELLLEKVRGADGLPSSPSGSTRKSWTPVRT